MLGSGLALKPAQHRQHANLQGGLTGSALCPRPKVLAGVAGGGGDLFACPARRREAV